LPLSKIEGLPAAWVTALSSSRGIYPPACPKTGEHYAGSATGAEGLYGGWLAHAQDGHGGNVGLKSRDPSDYQVSILEVAGSATTTEAALEMEKLWKLKPRSREMGLNRN
jgi:hypothetical protein